MKTQKKSLKNLHKREIFLIFAADLKHKKMAISLHQQATDIITYLNSHHVTYPKHLN